MRNIVYAYTNNFFVNKLREDDLIVSLNMPNLIADTIAVIIIVWAFNRHAREDFCNHKKDLYHIPHPPTSEQDIFSSVVIVLVTNLYAYYRLQRDTQTTSTGLDQTIDISE